MGGISEDGRNGKLIQSVVEMIVCFTGEVFPKLAEWERRSESESPKFGHARTGSSAGIFTRVRVGGCRLDRGGDANEGVCCGCRTSAAELFGTASRRPRTDNVDSASGRRKRCARRQAGTPNPKVSVYSSGTSSFFPRQSKDPPNRSIHSLIVLPGKRCLSPSVRCERLRPEGPISPANGTLITDSTLRFVPLLVRAGASSTERRDSRHHKFDDLCLTKTCPRTITQRQTALLLRGLRSSGIRRTWPHGVPADSVRMASNTVAQMNFEHSMNFPLDTSSRN